MAGVVPESALQGSPKAWLLAWATAGLVGCAGLPTAAPPDPVPGPPVPATWSGDTHSPAPAQPLAAWWRRFDDPLLVELVDQALRANTSVRSAQAALAQARALVQVQQAGLAPSLDGSASAQRNRNGNAGSSNSFKAGLDAAWSPDVFGSQRAAIAAAEASARASAATLGDTQVSVASEVALGYLGLRSNQARLAIAEQNLASQEETLQITQWRQQAGLLSTLEVEQARSATEQTRAALPGLRSARDQAVHALAVLTGRPLAELTPLLASIRDVPQAPPDLALALPAETLRQRADVQAAEQQVAAAWARATQANAARLPSFRLGGSLGLSALSLGALSTGGAVMAALLGSVSMPLFDGGAANAQLRAQQAALEQSRAAYQAVVLGALQEVEDALVALREDKARATSLQTAAESAASAALLARQRFASGLVDFQTVLDTQRSQLGTQDSLAQARASIAADHVRLYKALGGGWQAGDETAPTATPAADAIAAKPRITTP